MWLHKSSSEWEDSYFGGMVRVLNEYPEIKVPFQIETETPKDKNFDLRTWTRDKLLGLFQMKVNDYDLLSTFLKNATVVVKKNWLGMKKYYLCPNQIQVASCLEEIIRLDTELSNLFVHYQSLIIATSFFYPVPPPGKENGEGKGEKKDKNEGGKDDKDGEKAPGDKSKEKGEKKEPGSESGKGDEEQKEGKGGEKGEKEEEDGEGEGDPSDREADFEEPTTTTYSNAPSRDSIKEVVDMIRDIKKRQPFYASWELIPLTGDHKNSTKFKLMKVLPTPCTYTSQENIYASHLVNMLDISFDPTKDKVPNLKSGKLDVGKIGSIPAGNHHVYYMVEENQTTRPFSVCILMDESGSMTQNGKADRQNSLIKILYKAFSQIIPTNKIYIYGHSGGNSPEVRIYNDNFNQLFEHTIQRQFNNGWVENYDGPVIENIYERIRGVTSDNIIFISISDGAPSGSSYGGKPAVDDLKRIIEKCKRDGFVTVGIGVEYGLVKQIYNYHTVVTDLSNMAKQVSVLVNQVVKLEFQS